MKFVGSTQRLCCGALLLAAALIGGLNAFALMSMEARPIQGYSGTIRELQTNLQRFEIIQSTHALPFQLSWQVPELFNPFPSPGGGLDVPPSSQERTDRRSPGLEPTPLPVLSGIIRTLDANGSVYFQAVLNGRSCRKNDQIDNFTVSQITPAGVVLRRTELTWFIQCPMPPYSSDQGE
jgi:hypothetical protein